MSGGHLVTVGGHLVHTASGHLANDCEPAPAPCVCPPGLPTLLTLIGSPPPLFFGFNPLGGPPTCVTGASASGPLWNQVLKQYINPRTGLPVPCDWRATGINLNWQGTLIAQIGLRLIKIGTCKWLLEISSYAADGSASYADCMKLTGLTPFGAYIANAGPGVLPSCGQTAQVA